MKHWTIVFLAILSPLLFPIGFSALLAIFAAIWSPLIPLAVGLVADTLYFSPGAYAFPYFTLIGALATLAALGVHRFVQTSIMRR